ncbi:P-loop containing nucleoside triphosphate hydrolase protein [Xylaria palmicola]|nr:P-loop containing nucleoside triphosphate hydrolase protein [Xylaria palmicola]
MDIVLSSDAPGSPAARPWGEFPKAACESPSLKWVHTKRGAGMVCQTADLYHWIDQYGNTTWTGRTPGGIEKTEDMVTSALLVYHKRSADPCKKEVVVSITVQSPLLKEALHHILEGYPGVATGVPHLAFSRPFAPFFHRRDRLLAAVNDEQDQETKAHLKLLKNVLQAELGDTISAFRHYVKNSVIDYEHIWTLFEPGCIVLRARPEGYWASRIRDARWCAFRGHNRCFQLECVVVNREGGRFGYTTGNVYIMPFEGTKSILELECFPLSYHPNATGIKEELIDRGRRVEALSGYHYKHYKGQAVLSTMEDTTTLQPPKLVTVDSRIIVDHSAYCQATSFAPLECVWDMASSTSGTSGTSDTSNTESIAGHASNTLHNGRAKCQPFLNEEQLLLCCSFVRGYSLQDKKWLFFFVDHISDIVFNDHAFDSLVLPQCQKTLILTIAQAHFVGKNTFSDIFSNPGKSTTVLLSGGPGVGKTLTVEALSEYMRVPLFKMSAGDTSNVLEIIGMVARWNAILLLGECDVFLDARNTYDLSRDGKLLPFLHILDHYEGLLFLTTNRVKNMEESFKNRIHFHIMCPDLDIGARKTVWKFFLDRLDAGHDLSRGDLTNLAKLDMNARAIRNVLWSAMLVASGERLSMRHLKTVLQNKEHDLGGSRAYGRKLKNLAANGTKAAGLGSKKRAHRRINRLR